MKKNIPITTQILISAACIFFIAGLSNSVAFASDETCASCALQVGVSGDFTHRKYEASIAIQGAAGNAEAFLEEINGKNFTVSISHLPEGRYTISIGEALVAMSRAGRPYRFGGVA